MQELKKNSAEIYECKHYKEGVREMLLDPEMRSQVTGQGFQRFTCSIIGEWNREKSHPIQNMHINLDGTMIRTTSPISNVNTGDIIYFVNKWWVVEAVSFDVSAINPQASAYGDVLKNAVATIRIKAIMRNGVGVYD